MPTYYLQPGQHAHIHPRPRAYSQSYQHSPQVVYTHSAHSSHHSHSPHHYATAYPQQSGAYYNPSSTQYLSPNYQYDSGRHHHQGHARSGSGGVYYASSDPARHQDYSRHSPSHHSGHRRSSSSHARQHRSHSVPRPVVQADSGRSHHRRSSSRPRQSPPHHQTVHRDRPVGEPLSERIRRMFGFGSGQSSSRSHHRDYVDARSGRTVDWRGRPIYRV